MTRRTLSPVSLMLLCWGITGTFSIWALMSLEHLPLVQTFILRENLDLSAITFAGVLWILFSLSIYVLADWMARLSLPKAQTFRPNLNVETAAKLTFTVNACFATVTLIWIAATAHSVGGLTQLAAAVYLDSLSTRDMLLEKKLFTGMRLFYAALPATGCLAAAFLAHGHLSLRARRMCKVTLALNLILLFLLPIVMSQRLLLLQFLLSSYIATCLVRGKIFGLRWLGLGVCLFLGLWFAREIITNPSLDQSAADIAWQKLAFYIVNDMWNSLAPLSRPIPHTHGALTFEGLTFLTFTDGLFHGADPSQIPELNAVLGGGEFPFFTTAYVDFGPILGMAVIAGFAILFRLVFYRACQSLGWAAIYAQIGAALLFSSHSVYVTHQNFLFSIAVIAVICRLARRTPQRSRHRAPQRAVPVFRSRRKAHIA
ncbi:oligosaccharide repeat unit polymerase [Roseovarius phycicola]|uniref:Oligosaccharide repeat unit polymerase n=1 Tax=Roseovarius phycicola TaxID=3080976 RepID=A0ABZ2HII0_9RHOB